jgi:hypothetical protein
MADKTITEVLRRALKADKRPLLQVARAAGLPYASLYGFRSGERKGLRLESAERLAKVLGLELRPKARKGR